ncbi:MAG: helix-turn-helix domain-containing protein, partial [bacterium]|nr:helix-turn-helix domain-containing protein [bacterium]
AFAASDTIEPADLSVISDSFAEPPETPPETLPKTMIETMIDSRSDYESDAIRKALKQTSYNRREAASVLGISEATLYRRIKQYDL